MEPKLVALGVGAALAIGLLVWAIVRVSRRATELHGKEMGLLDHLRELRFRVLASLAAIAAVSVFLFSFDVRPVVVLGTSLYAPVPSVTTSLASRGLELLLQFSLPETVRVVVITPSEAIMAQFQASIVGALLLAAPVVAYQVAAFIAPALHPEERRTFAWLAPISGVLFVAGVLFAIFLMVPLTLATLYEYAGPLGAEPLARPQDIVMFVMVTSVLFGAAFELPLIMFGLAYKGLVDPATMGRHWRGVIVGTLIVGAVLTDPNPVTQILVGVPVIGLYFGGLLVARIAWRRRPSARSDPHPSST